MIDYAKIDDLLWQLSLTTFYTMRRVRQLECNTLDIHSRYFVVLDTIQRLGKEATLSNLAKQLVLEVNSLSSQLTRMEKDGLIEKQKDQKRKNLMHVRITDKGYEYAIRGKEKKTIHSIMSVLTNEEKRDLWEIISKIRKKAMEELGKDVNNLYPPSDINELCDSHRSFQIQ